MFRLRWEGPYTKSFRIGTDNEMSLMVQGIERDCTVRLEAISPQGGYQTELKEPCGARPRKCLFIYLYKKECWAGQSDYPWAFTIRR
jgi:hypothetical protein